MTRYHTYSILRRCEYVLGVANDVACTRVGTSCTLIPLLSRLDVSYRRPPNRADVSEDNGRLPRVELATSRFGTSDPRRVLVVVVVPAHISSDGSSRRRIRSNYPSVALQPIASRRKTFLASRVTRGRHSPFAIRYSRFATPA